MKAITVTTKDGLNCFRLNKASMIEVPTLVYLEEAARLAKIRKNPSYLKSVNIRFRRTAYRVTRKEIGRVLRSRKHIFHGFTGKRPGPFGFSGNRGLLKLGCCLFEGKDAAIIKRWAKA